MKLLYTLLLLLTAIPYTYSAHIIGGEMTYECLGNDPNNPGSILYKITMRVYRDCLGGGASFDSAGGPGGGVQGTVSIFEGNNMNSVEDIVLGPPFIEMLDPDPNNNPCVEIPPDVCVERGVYTFEVSLPVSTQTYTITYQRCCRNNGINNILNSGDVGATYHVEITPQAQNECNNSPVFNDFPPIVICVNRSFEFDHVATDVDGDVLLYEFCSPLEGGNLGNVAPDPDAPPPYNGVAFQVPAYSPTNPVGGNPQISIDPNTGIITGTPDVQGLFVVGVCVKEYRNGQLMSTVQRDFQFNVTFCEPDIVASPGDPNVNGEFVYSFCGQKDVTLENKSYKVDKITGYEWRVDFVDSIYVTDEIHPFVNFPTYGTFSGLLIVNPGIECTDTAKFTVLLAPPVNPDFSFDYDTCVAGPVGFVNLTDTTPLGIDVLEWTFGDGPAVVNDFDTRHTYATAGTYIAELYIKDTFGCEEMINKTVDWFPAPPILIVDPSAFRGCPPVSVNFENLSHPIDNTYKLNWQFGTGDSSNLISPSHQYDTPGVYDVYLHVTSPIGCTIDTTWKGWIVVNEPPVADFTFTPDNPTNFAPQVRFLDRSTDDKAPVSWFWDFDGEGNSYEKNPAFSFADTGLQYISVIVADADFCQDTAYGVVRIYPEISYHIPNAFTPNDDGKNDIFLGTGYLIGLRSFSMTIWDRYGSQVFQTTDPYIGWNGRENNTGELLQNGVYMCIVQYTGPQDRTFERKGYVTLMR